MINNDIILQIEKVNFFSCYERLEDELPSPNCLDALSHSQLKTVTFCFFLKTLNCFEQWIP